MMRTTLFTSLLFSASLALAQAQPATTPYTPEVGQPGKDVVWVPTPQAVVDKMLNMAKVTKNDYVIDLGSGDGRTVITAAKRGATAVGIEYNPDMVELSKANARIAGVTDRASFMKADLFQADFSKATVITMFLLPEINRKLRPKLLGLKPGTRVVSNTFTMAEWQADETHTVSGDACDGSWCTALLWIIPASFAGTWQMPQGELTLKQTFQMVSGTLKTAERAVPVAGRVRGEELLISAGGKQFRGRRKGDSIEIN
jgi:SAM-dependent methyltransferase